MKGAATFPARRILWQVCKLISLIANTARAELSLFDYQSCCGDVPCGDVLCGVPLFASDAAGGVSGFGIATGFCPVGRVFVFPLFQPSLIGRVIGAITLLLLFMLILLAACIASLIRHGRRGGWLVVRLRFCHRLRERWRSIGVTCICLRLFVWKKDYSILNACYLHRTLNLFALWLIFTREIRNQVNINGQIFCFS